MKMRSGWDLRRSSSPAEISNAPSPVASPGALPGCLTPLAGAALGAVGHVGEKQNPRRSWFTKTQENKQQNQA